MEMIFKTRFFWRIYLSYVLVVLATTVILGGLLARQVAQSEFEDVNTILQSQADLISRIIPEPLRNRDYQELGQLVSNLAENTGSRFTIIDSNGVVLADSHENPRQMDNHLRRPEVLDAMNQGSGYATRFSQTLQQQLNYYAVYLDSPDGNLGFVRTALTVTGIIQDIEARQGTILKYSILAAFLAMVVGFFLADRLAQPLSRMSTLAEDIASGDFDRRVPVGNNGGLGKLSEAINQLARDSAMRVSEITAERNRLAAIFAGMVEGVIGVDQDQKIIHINDAASLLLGINPKICLNKSMWEEIRIQQITNALDEAIKTQEVIKTQMRLSRESDELVVDIYVASLSTDSGESIGAVIVLHDITELEKLERVRTDFVANASHELKTPITAIRGLSETILGDEDIDMKTLRRFVDRIHSQSMRLSYLIGDLMTISRLESAGNEVEFTLINMSELVRNAAQAAESAFEEKKQKLSFELETEEIQVNGDGENLRQLVDNLIDNAIKYTPEEGEINLTLKQQDEQVIFSVEDSGIGISSQYQQRVFERFYRVDKARSLSLGGTGLGLSIVKNIAEQHGGSVGLQSQPGSGSKFIVSLPAFS